MRKFFLLLAAALVLFVGFTVAVTARYESVQPPVQPVPEVAIPDGAAERLAGSLRIRTISSEDPAAFDADAFETLHQYLQTAFPRVHAQLRRETVGTHSLLYTGKERPLSQSDPADRAPGRGTSRDGHVGEMAAGSLRRPNRRWIHLGRGAIDNKSAVLGTLEAVEMLLAEGFRPVRTVYLAYGHDEEVGGVAGAREIAALLKARGVELEMVLDEGGVIGDGILPGISEPVALVGIAEKGFVTIELSTRVAGGHSSLPPRQSAVGILSAAVARLENTQMAARLEGPTRQLFDRIGPRFPTMQRAVFANLWLTAPLVLRSLEESPHHQRDGANDYGADDLPSGNEGQRAPQPREGCHQLRILPGDTVASVVEHVKCGRRQPRGGQDRRAFLSRAVGRVQH